MAPLKLGKLPPALLEELLSRLPSDPRLLIGPHVGEDAAAISMGDSLLIAKTDPITFATDNIGWYAVHVNANDIAVMGGEPRWFLATVLLPEGAGPELPRQIFNQLESACRSLGVSLAGGHTEVTRGLSRPIVVGCMLGEASPDALTPSSRAEANDEIILSKGIAIEGTATLALDHAEMLTSRGVRQDLIDRAAGYLFEPGISVVRDARLARQAAAVHAMHDPTEGGLATGLWEMAQASSLGLEIDGSKISVLPETGALCQALSLDPLGLLASGALIVACPAPSSPAIISALTEAGIPAAVIGRFVSEEKGYTVASAGQSRALPNFPRDELARWLEEEYGA